MQVLRPLVEASDDTELAAGSECYNTGLKFYKSVQMAAEMNVPGADSISDDLGERFAGQGNSGTPPPPVPPTP